MGKLNRNGFAISTMLYGLLIVMILLMSLLMSTISFERSNSKKFVSNVINDLEFRDLTPPTITISKSPETLYTKTAHELSVTLSASDDTEIDLSRSYTTSFSIGTYSLTSLCTSSNLSSDHKTATIHCSLNIPEENDTVGKLKINTPKVFDIYGNSSKVVSLDTGYEFKTDDIAPIFEISSSKRGQYYPDTWNNNLITVKLCDNNSKGTLTYVDAQKQSEVTVKIGTHTYNSALHGLRSENNCKIFGIRPVLNNFLEGNMEIILPGVEDGNMYGWKDKHGNINKRTRLSTDITFISGDKVALQLEKIDNTTLYIGREYTLEGNINIVSRRCTSQRFHDISTGISPTCKIGDKIVDCELKSDIENRKLNYRIKINSNNKATGKVTIAIPKRIVEDCYNQSNDGITMNLGPEVVAP
ncbi:MAG: hypothetical protein HFJ12_05215 [Bacilli bacterium]|nr:hypothetical protein [Bacilli bacterium]